jgi:predicted methyltransferase
MTRRVGYAAVGPLSLLTAVACGGADLPRPSAPTAAKVGSLPLGDHNVKTTKDVEVPAAIKALLDAPDRDASDKELDAGRKPGEMLAFFGVQPGMKVAEIGAGGGYTSELLARAVGPSGRVYGVNTKWVLEKFADKPWSARLAKPVNKNIVRLDREIEDPFPADVKDLDAVFLVLIYHDLFWLGGDRDKMNKAIFAALKPGGVYGIVDHAGRAGTGATEVDTLHRIEEKVVREEVLRAGFKLVEQGDFLRNPSDTRDWNDAPFAAKDRRGKSDRFVLKFVKP